MSGGMETKSLLILGGLGLFLLGMILLTEGLQRLAGNSLRKTLARFTSTPVTGAATGAVATAIVQSSSAITVTAVGFVGAGLLSFPQALGIIFGANIGTTITGWFVAILGFKLKLGMAALPLLPVGVLLRLFGSPRLRNIGWALAGFALLFVGIDVMKDGAAQFEGIVTPDTFPPDTLPGRFLLLLIGVAITLVTQSSSAGVATALVALGAGAVSFTQAAAMVIGMDVGTTFTAGLATIGGSNAMRRTGYAHIIYNIATGALAFALLGPFTTVIQTLTASAGTSDAQISLVAFHTAFNALGVILVLPFTGKFSCFIEGLVPETGPPLLRRLDTRLLGNPASAVDAAAATIRDIAMELTKVVSRLTGPDPSARKIGAELHHTIEGAIASTREFVQQIATDPADEDVHKRHVAAMHALDHLVRLQHRCTQRDRINALRDGPRLRRLARLMCVAAASLRHADDLGPLEDRLKKLRSLFKTQGHRIRESVVEAASSQPVNSRRTLLQLDGARWLYRIGHHLWRITHHLNLAELPARDRSSASDRPIKAR